LPPAPCRKAARLSLLYRSFPRLDLALSALLVLLFGVVLFVTVMALVGSLTHADFSGAL
jgi:hypothetical protein